jgi:hypothetical protein
MNEDIEIRDECFVEESLPKSISYIKNRIPKGSLVHFTNYKNNVWYSDLGQSITTYFIKDLEYLENIIDKAHQYFTISLFGYSNYDVQEKVGIYRYKDINEHGIALGYVNTFSEDVTYSGEARIFVSIVVLFGDGIHIVPSDLMKMVKQ